MARHYELVLMLDPEVPDADRNKVVASVRAQIESGGTLDHSDSWGLRKMAYEIEQRTEADYRYFRFQGDNKLLESLDHNLKIVDGALRFRIFKVDPESPTTPPPTGGASPAAPSAAAARRRCGATPPPPPAAGARGPGRDTDGRTSRRGRAARRSPAGSAPDEPAAPAEPAPPAEATPPGRRHWRHHPANCGLSSPPGGEKRRPAT